MSIIRKCRYEIFRCFPTGGDGHGLGSWAFDGSKIAVFSDIHSNFQALWACYEDARIQGVQGFVFLGDYISDLADVRQTLDLVYEIQARYPTVCLRGNRERYMLECQNGHTAFQPGSRSGSLLYTYRLLREDDFRFLEQLPAI